MKLGGSLPNSAKLKREKSAEALIANLAISSTSRIQELSDSDGAEEFVDVTMEDKVNQVLLSSEQSKGLTDLDFTSLSKVVEKLQNLTLQDRSFIRKFILDTGAMRHIICCRAYF